MPGLDAHMDRIAAELLSRWITSSSLNSLSWYNVDKAVWTKSGEIIGKYKTLSISIIYYTYILYIINKVIFFYSRRKPET